MMRALRIYPGAIFCLLVTTLVLGPIVTSLAPSAYLTSSSTYCYIRDNWSFTDLLQLWSPICTTLPGLFEKNRYAGAVNGSLWTLWPEVACYSYVMVLGILGCLKSRMRIVLTIAAILVIHACFPKLIPFFYDDHYTDKLKVAMFFLAGVLAYAFREAITLRWTYCLVLIIAAAFLQKTDVQEYSLYIALFYLVVISGSSQRLRSVRFHGDFSYGMYLYGWPIQQTVAQFFPDMTSYPSNIICIPAALGCAYVSWKLIERPAIMVGRRLTV